MVTIISIVFLCSCRPVVFLGLTGRLLIIQFFRSGVLGVQFFRYGVFWVSVSGYPIEILLGIDPTRSDKLLKAYR